MVRPAVRRRAVEAARTDHGLTERRACALMGMDRSSFRYRSRRPDDGELRSRLRWLAGQRPRYGARRLYVLLRREGRLVNHKRIERLYRLEGLAVRRRRRKRVAAVSREARPLPTGVNERWSMDFTHDATAEGRAFRTLNIVDDWSRECIAIDVARSIPGERVAAVLGRLARQRGLPKAIVVDNGPEFVSQALDAWAYRAGVQLQFIEPGKPVQNAFVESFNGSFRDECLNQHWFETIEDAMARIEAWRLDYNRFRPHSSLGDLTPEEFAARRAA